MLSIIAVTRKIGNYFKNTGMSETYLVSLYCWNCEVSSSTMLNPLLMQRPPSTTIDAVADGVPLSA